MHMEKTLAILFRTLCVSLLSIVLCPLSVWAQDRQATTRADECIAIFNDVLRQVDVNYVDTLNYEDLTETAINAMLRHIDPYTVYYPEEGNEHIDEYTVDDSGDYSLTARTSFKNDYDVIYTK